jgi:hypothetical protein
MKTAPAELSHRQMVLERGQQCVATATPASGRCCGAGRWQTRGCRAGGGRKRERPQGARTPAPLLRKCRLQARGHRGPGCVQERRRRTW